MNDDTTARDRPFILWMPMLKSMASDEMPAGYKHRGVMSTEEWDQQGEMAIQKQMDFSYFLKSGLFNWNHRDGAEFLVGEPTDARLTELGAIPDYPLQPHQTGREPAVYIEGVLYKGIPEAEAVWRLMQVLGEQDAGYKRRLGYSVQGGITQRLGNVLAKSFVRHCAITHEPVNASSLAMLAKSFGAEPDVPQGADYEVYENLGGLFKAMDLEGGGNGPTHYHVFKLSNQDMTAHKNTLVATYGGSMQADAHRHATVFTREGLENGQDTWGHVGACRGGQGCPSNPYAKSGIEKSFSGSAALASVALGLIPCERNCHDGSRYIAGASGMLDHLVKCANWEPGAAKDYVLALKKGLQ